MSAQIIEFGQQNKFTPDTVIMNHGDMVRYRNLKDADGNKLFRIFPGEEMFIAGLRVVISPIVPANTLYVLDSTRGRINRKPTPVAGESVYHHGLLG